MCIHIAETTEISTFERYEHYVLYSCKRDTNRFLQIFVSKRSKKSDFQYDIK